MRVTFDIETYSWSITWRDLLLHYRLADGALLADYFGPASSADAFPGLEVFDALTRTRADIAIQLAPGDQRVLWAFSDWAQPDADTFTLNLRATDLPLRAALRVTVDPETGIARHHAAIAHTGNGPELPISYATSMAIVLPSEVREVVHLAGRWGAEAQAQRLAMPQSALLLESRSGKAGFDFLPYVALLAPGHTYFTELLWSGNWQYYIRRLPGGRVLLAGGLNGWGLRPLLKEGDELALPDVLLGCVGGDLNAATQQLHSYRRRLRPDPPRPISVQFNSWFPYQGEPTIDAMKAYATRAAQLGCEVFVLDAGWYTTEAECAGEDWWLRAGDWIVDRNHFPNGLEELSSYCRTQGIAFGLWIEPEAVGPSARIRREHPEWLHAIGGRGTPPDQRAILNLGVPQARAWIYERILALLRDTGARWLKWDFNADLAQGGWAPGLPPELTRQDPLIAHYQALYALQDEVRAAVPDLILEMCASGGSRFDAAILSHAHTYWISDQTHPLMKLAIHFGSQLAHPPEQCNDWLAEWPPHEAQHDPLRATRGEQGDLPFRLRVAMLGSFGISAPLDRWSDEDIAIVKNHVSWYKQVVRPITQSARQYLLSEMPPLDGNGDWAAIWYVLPGGAQGVLFAFRLANGAPTQTFALPGLNPSGIYRLSTPEGRKATAGGVELATGLAVDAETPFRSVLLAVTVIKEDFEPCALDFGL